MPFARRIRNWPGDGLSETLSGRYAGSFGNQAKKIRDALANPDKNPQIIEDFQIEADDLGEELQAIPRCQNCRRLNRRECMACRDQTIRGSGGAA